MKNRIIIFFIATLLSLLVIPTINIFSAPNIGAIKWRDKSFLYNMDFGARWLARFLYPIGISIDPKQVIIGHDNWLYLGDMYEQTRSVTRRPPTLSDVELGKKIGAATEAWDSYLSSKGVQLFRIMIGPNKGTVYPEYIPNWAKPASPGVTDALIKGTDTTNYIDLRGPLLAAKKIYPEDLYYKTDTHWNDVGAGIGFRFFAQQVAPLMPGVQWPPESAYSVVRVDPRQGGDLANFLRLGGILTDSQPIIRNTALSVETTQYDFDTMQVVQQGGNPEVMAPTKPLLIRSEGALNKKKVLWLRDSFGTAMSPLMATTFTEVLQLHWGEALKPGGRFLQMVTDWKPDYIFLTVVERSARASQFASYPPPVIINVDDGFRPIRITNSIGINHLEKGHSEGEYRIIGIDPFVDFGFSNVVNSSEARFLDIDLNCDDGSPSVPLQLFWLQDGCNGYDEEHSLRFSFPTGQRLIDLHSISNLGSVGPILRVRLDIESQKSCQKFKLKKLNLGNAQIIN